MAQANRKASKYIPDVVVVRLPMYVRALTLLQQSGIDYVSSRYLGAQLGVTPAQIRKDLSHFGRFGRQGRGYGVGLLLDELRQILGLNRGWQVAIIGTGRLGRAIMDYKGFIPAAFTLVAAFDKDPAQIGKKAGGVVVQDVAELKKTLGERRVDIAIVSVPPSEAQGVIDQVSETGVKAVVNYAPIAARVPQGMRLRSVDPVLALESLAFYLSRDDDNKKDVNKS